MDTVPFYDLGQFVQLCSRLKPGEYASINAEAFESIFSCAMLSGDGMVKARGVALTVGLDFESRPDLGEVWFIRPKGKKGAAGLA